MTIEGFYVSPTDAWWLVDELRSVGRAVDVLAALTIEACIGANGDDELSDYEKDALLEALADAPAGLRDLRGALAMDRRHRQGG